jgi:hypothetical protein
VVNGYCDFIQQCFRIEIERKGDSSERFCPKPDVWIHTYIVHNEMKNNRKALLDNLKVEIRK